MHNMTKPPYSKINHQLSIAKQWLVHSPCFVLPLRLLGPLYLPRWPIPCQLRAEDDGECHPSTKRLQSVKHSEAQSVQRLPFDCYILLLQTLIATYCN